MKSIAFVLLFLCLFLSGMTPLPAQTNGIDQDSELLIVPAGDKFLRWYGHAGRCYFIQVSDPADHLNKWTWAPIIESGNDEEISYEVDGTPDKGFFRLHYTAQVPGAGETLETADFDHDGISNWDEINLCHTDPLNADTDGDGYTDGEEVAAGTSPLDPTAYPLKVIASQPAALSDASTYYGFPCDQPVILYLNQAIPGNSTITGSWIHELFHDITGEASGTTVILPGRRSVAFLPSGNAFDTYDGQGNGPALYTIEFTAATTGLQNLLPFSQTFTAMPSEGAMDGAPRVLSEFPADGNIDVSCGICPTVSWSGPLDPTTVIPANVTIVSDTNASVPCSVGFDYRQDVNRLSITPAASLAPSTRYTVTLGTGFHGLTGKPLGEAVFWSFTTRPARPGYDTGGGPYVESVTPSDYSFGISPPACLSVVFSEDMDAATLTPDHIHIRAGGGSDLTGNFAYTASTRTLVFQPASPFLPSTYYTTTLDLPLIFNNRTEESGDRKAMQGNGTFVFATADTGTTGGGGGGNGGGGGGTGDPHVLPPFHLSYSWGELSDPSGDADCRVDIFYIKRNGNTSGEVLPPDPSQTRQQNGKEITPGTSIVITPNYVSDDGDGTSGSEPDNRVRVKLPADATTSGVSYHVFLESPPEESGGSGPQIEYLGKLTPGAEFDALCKVGCLQQGPQTLRIVPIDIVPDYNRDGQINDMDRGKATQTKPWRYWLNNTRDEGDTVGSDIPANETIATNYNYVDEKVDGRRDLINFFPVQVDLCGMLRTFPPGTFKYKIGYHVGNEPEQEDIVIGNNPNSMGVLWNPEAKPEESGKWTRELAKADILLEKPVVHITKSYSADIPDDMLVAAKSGEGLVWLEAGEIERSSETPLRLDIYDMNGTVIASIPLPMKVSNVEDMFRQKYVMPGVPDLASGDMPGDPTNWPDADRNGKHFVFVHGYNVSGDEGRGWAGAMFRRLFWSGSNARFTAFFWRGNETQIDGVGTRNYHCNVENAFGTAKSFSQFINLLDGEKTVAAHSLGNMLVLSSIHDWNAPITNYLMLDAAVPMEAIDGTSPNDTVSRTNALTGTTAPVNEDMVHIDWENAPEDRYKPQLWASEWHSLWTGGDGRSKLTWRNRLSNLRNVNVYNFYSTGEEVLDHHAHADQPSRDDTIFGHPTGRYAWAIQEKLKGCLQLNGTGGSNYGGWGFGDVTNAGSPMLSAVAANTLTADDLRQLPFFNRNFDSQLFGSTGSDYATANRNMLLAHAFPATSLALGKEPLTTAIDEERNFDMQTSDFQNGWPASKTNNNGKTDWYHCDVREVAYLYTYKLFNIIVEIGSLK